MAFNIRYFGLWSILPWEFDSFGPGYSGMQHTQLLKETEIPQRNLYQICGKSFPDFSLRAKVGKSFIVFTKIFRFTSSYYFFFHLITPCMSRKNPNKISDYFGAHVSEKIVIWKVMRRGMEQSFLHCCEVSRESFVSIKFGVVRYFDFSFQRSPVHRKGVSKFLVIFEGVEGRVVVSR